VPEHKQHALGLKASVCRHTRTAGLAQDTTNTPAKNTSKYLIELLYTNPREDLPPRHAPQRDPDEEDVREDARVDDPRYHSSE
jgi:hypothetical protein